MNSAQANINPGGARTPPRPPGGVQVLPARTRLPGNQAQVSAGRAGAGVSTGPPSIPLGRRPSSILGPWMAVSGAQPHPPEKLPEPRVWPALPPLLSINSAARQRAAPPPGPRLTVAVPAAQRATVHRSGASDGPGRHPRPEGTAGIPSDGTGPRGPATPPLFPQPQEPAPTRGPALPHPLSPAPHGPLTTPCPPAPGSCTSLPVTLSSPAQV